MLSLIHTLALIHSLSYSSGDAQLLKIIIHNSGAFYSLIYSLFSILMSDMCCFMCKFSAWASLVLFTLFFFPRLLHVYEFKTRLWKEIRKTVKFTIIISHKKIFLVLVFLLLDLVFFLFSLFLFLSRLFQGARIKDKKKLFIHTQDNRNCIRIHYFFIFVLRPFLTKIRAANLCFLHIVATGSLLIKDKSIIPQPRKAIVLEQGSKQYRMTGNTEIDDSMQT